MWIGEASQEVDEETSRPLSDLGMDFIHDPAVEIAERSNPGQDIGRGLLYQEYSKKRRAFEMYDEQVFTPRVRGLYDILHRSWWKRLWVLQEVSLAQSGTLICGNKTEALHNLTIVISALVRKGQLVEELDFSTRVIVDTFHQFYMRKLFQSNRIMGGRPYTRGKKALEILNATRNSRASDPRDKIYGILGFFGDPESDPENILPRADYNKTAAELYTEVSHAIIIHTGSLDIMSSCYGFFRPSIPDLPSWVASWNDTPLRYFDEDTFNAASSSPVVYEDSGDGRTLRIKGRKVDTVMKAGFKKGKMTYNNDTRIELWREWADIAFSLESCPTGESIEEVFMQTLCWGNDQQ